MKIADLTCNIPLARRIITRQADRFAGRQGFHQQRPEIRFIRQGGEKQNRFCVGPDRLMAELLAKLPSRGRGFIRGKGLHAGADFSTQTGLGALQRVGHGRGRNGFTRPGWAGRRKFSNNLPVTFSFRAVAPMFRRHFCGLWLPRGRLDNADCQDLPGRSLVQIEGGQRYMLSPMPEVYCGRQIFFGNVFHAPFFELLLTQVSTKAMPIQPSSMLAYFEPSQANGLPACHLRTSASKQRCSRA